MSGACKIYTLHDPDTLVVRYVGFTSKSLEDRLLGHIKSSKISSFQNHRVAWIRSLTRAGKNPVILFVETVTKENWQAREQFWISHFRRSGCDLTNSCDGGEGVVNPSNETRARLSAALKGRVFSAETRAKIGNFHRGKIISAEQRAKISAKLTGRTVPGHVREKMRASKLGVVFSDEHRRKLREANLGKKASKEARENMSAARLGGSHSAETRRKISESIKKPVTDPSTGMIFCSGDSAAVSLGVCRRTVTAWLKSGRLTYANNKLKEVISS